MRTRYWKAVLATVLATVLVVGVAIPTLAQTVIDIAAVPGVTAPVLGASPVAAITETAQYTGAVVWAPTDDPFLGAQVYTATITLTAKAGYTLPGVAEDFFTVAGVTTDTNPASSGVITAVFPATAAAVIDIAAVPGVTA
ncbi:MAG: LytR family transcriptional regulator, partial [Candidatus Atribacteria bacterium]